MKSFSTKITIVPFTLPAPVKLSRITSETSESVPARALARVHEAPERAWTLRGFRPSSWFVACRFRAQLQCIGGRATAQLSDALAHGYCCTVA